MDDSKHRNVSPSQQSNVEETGYAFDMEGLGRRVREARDAKGWTQTQLAKVVSRLGFEVGQSAIGNIEASRTREPKCIPELAQALGVTVSWLRTGKGEKSAPAETLDGTETHDANNERSNSLSSNVRHLDANVTRVLRSGMPRNLPVLGTVSCGSGGVVMGPDAIDYVRRPSSLDGRDDVFALYVEDISMQPAFNPGDTVIVEGKRPRIGDHVVVEFRVEHQAEHGAILKKLKAMTPTVLRLEQYNPPRTTEIKRDQVIRIRRVMTMGDLLGI